MEIVNLSTPEGGLRYDEVITNPASDISDELEDFAKKILLDRYPTGERLDTNMLSGIGYEAIKEYLLTNVYKIVRT